MRRDRELIVIVALVVLAALGVGYGHFARSVPATQLARSVALKGGGFSSRALYCPPSVSATQDKATVAVTARAGSVPFSVQGAVRPSAVAASPSPSVSSASPTPRAAAASEASSPQKAIPTRVRLAPSRRDRAVNVVGYGGPLLASAVTDGASGAGAAPCARAAGRLWYFADGSSALGYNERLILYNPFPDEAVARISFITPSGKQTKANLADQAVPAGATTILRLNDFVLKQPLLSLEVEVIRGRLVAWRSLRLHLHHRPRSQQFSLGATTSQTESFFPDGAFGKGYDERIALLNPNPKVARVSISVLTEKRTVQPPKLLNLTIPPASSRRVALQGAIRGCSRRVCGLGAVVTSTNDVGIVAERTIRYATGHVVGAASEIGATKPARDWYLGPAALHPTRDVLAVIDPTTATAKVSVQLIGVHGKPLSPKALQDLKVKAGTRLQLSINRWTRGKPFVAMLTSSQEVVAERFSYSRRWHDASALMGQPLP